MTDIAQRVRRVVAFILKVDEDGLVGEARFVEDLHATSLDVVELIMALEDEFAIEISDSDAERIATVADVIGVVRSKARLPAGASA